VPLKSNSKRLVPGSYIYRDKNGRLMTPHKLNGFYVLPRGTKSQQGEVKTPKLTKKQTQTLVERFLNKRDSRSRK